jgi:predicted Zn-dependent protease
VIGWQQPPRGDGGDHAWASGVAGETLVDSDIAIDPATVTTPQVLASVITHEFGHAIGLAHSAPRIR